MPVDRLTIDDMSDREFLLALMDLADEDGWTDSDAMRERLDLETRRIASTRLSWLARWGVVEREHERDQAGNLRYRRSGKPVFTQRWRLTPDGEAVALGNLGVRNQRALDQLTDEQLMVVTRWLTERARGGNAVARKMVAREWRYGTSEARDGRVHA